MLRRMLRSRGDTMRWQMGEPTMPLMLRRDSANPWHDKPRSPLICSCKAHSSEKMFHTMPHGLAFSAGDSMMGWLSHCTVTAEPVVSRVMSSSVLLSAAKAMLVAE